MDSATPEQIMGEFVQLYYTKFDQDLSGILEFYRDQSTLTFESSASQGKNAIVEKLKSLPFLQQIQHQVTTMDAQRGFSPNTFLVLVTGQLLVAGEEKPMNFTQTFLLAPDASGTPYVHNDIFKLIYG